MAMAECPRYRSCSAPICPLDLDWKHRKHLPPERVCLWLTELAKPNGLQVVSEELGFVAHDIAKLSPQITAKFCNIGYTVAQAAHTGSRILARRRAGARLNHRGARSTVA